MEPLRWITENLFSPLINNKMQGRSIDVNIGGGGNVDRSPVNFVGELRSQSGGQGQAVQNPGAIGVMGNLRAY